MILLLFIKTSSNIYIVLANRPFHKQLFSPKKYQATTEVYKATYNMICNR